MFGHRGARTVRTALVVALFTGVVALPSSATAAPPTNDDYAAAFRVNEPGTTLPRDVTYNGSTTDATLEQFEIDEAASCSGNDYGATVHFEVYPDRPGLVQVQVYSAEFLTSVAVWRFTPDGELHDPICNTAPASNRTADLVYPSSPGRVQEGQGYNVQIGGLDEGGGFGEGAYSARFIFYPDTDRDGFLDFEDSCEATGGPNADKHRGCPDSDGDNLIDREDACPGDAGDVSKHRGCPDADGDNIPEGSGGSDRCPGLGGRDADKHLGCPDNDGDSIAEGAGASPRDGCPTVNPDKVDRGDRKPRDGCPDTLRIASTAAATVHFVPGGVVIDSFALKAVPKGARVQVVCRLPRRGRCGGLLIRRASASGTQPLARAARTVGVKKRIRSRLPFGSRITASIKARYARSRFIRVTVVRRVGLSKVCGTSPSRLKRCK